MELNIVCGTWISPNDEKVINVLKDRDDLPTVDELIEITGLSKAQVEHTLIMLKRQKQMKSGRERYLNKSED